ADCGIRGGHVTGVQTCALPISAVGDATTAVLHAERYIEELKDMERDFPTASRGVVAESAGRADLLAFQPGDVILREGDPADRFYMIINGQALATARGPDGAEAHLNTLGPGDYFGEIGLLNNAPRIATVRAKTSLEVMALDR